MESSNNNSESIRQQHAADSAQHLNNLVKTILYPGKYIHSYSSETQNNYKTKPLTKIYKITGDGTDNRFMIIAAMYSSRPVFACVYKYNTITQLYAWSHNIVREANINDYESMRLVACKITVSSNNVPIGSTALGGSMDVIEFAGRVTEAGDFTDPNFVDDLADVVEDTFYKIVGHDLCTVNDSEGLRDRGGLCLLSFPSSPTVGFHRINDVSPVSIGTNTAGLPNPTVTRSRFEPATNNSITSVSFNQSLPNYTSASTLVEIADVTFDTPSFTGIKVRGQITCVTGVLAAGMYGGFTVVVTTMNPFGQVVQTKNACEAYQIIAASGVTSKSMTFPIFGDLISTDYIDSQAQLVAFSRVQVYCVTTAALGPTANATVDIDFISPSGDEYGVNYPITFLKVDSFSDGQVVDIKTDQVVDLVVNGSFLKGFTPTPAPHIIGIDEFFSGLFSDRRQIGLKSFFTPNEFQEFAAYLLDIDTDEFIMGKASSFTRFMKKSYKALKKGIRRAPHFINTLAPVVDEFVPGLGTKAKMITDLATGNAAGGPGYHYRASADPPPYSVSEPVESKKLVSTGKIRRRQKPENNIEFMSSTDGPYIRMYRGSGPAPVMFTVVDSTDDYAGYLYALIPGVVKLPFANSPSVPDSNRKYRVYNATRCSIPFPITRNYTCLQVKSFTPSYADYYLESPCIGEYSWLAALAFSSAASDVTKEWFPMVITGSAYLDSGKVRFGEVRDLKTKLLTCHHSDMLLMGPNIECDLRVKDLAELINLIRVTEPKKIDSSAEFSKMLHTGRASQPGGFERVRPNPKAKAWKDSLPGSRTLVQSPANTTTTVVTTTTTPTPTVSASDNSLTAIMARERAKMHKEPPAPLTQKLLSVKEASAKINEVVRLTLTQTNPSDPDYTAFAAYWQAFADFSGNKDAIAEAGVPAAELPTLVARCLIGGQPSSGTVVMQVGGNLESMTYEEKISRAYKNLTGRLPPDNVITALFQYPALWIFTSLTNGADKLLSYLNSVQRDQGWSKLVASGAVPDRRVDTSYFKEIERMGPTSAYALLNDAYDEEEWEPVIGRLEDALSLKGGLVDYILNQPKIDPAVVRNNKSVWAGIARAKETMSAKAKGWEPEELDTSIDQSMLSKAIKQAPTAASITAWATSAPRLQKPEGLTTSIVTKMVEIATANPSLSINYPDLYMMAIGRLGAPQSGVSEVGGSRRRRQNDQPSGAQPKSAALRKYQASLKRTQVEEGVQQSAQQSHTHGASQPPPIFSTNQTYGFDHLDPPTQQQVEEYPQSSSGKQLTLEDFTRQGLSEPQQEEAVIEDADDQGDEVSPW